MSMDIGDVPSQEELMRMQRETEQDREERQMAQGLAQRQAQQMGVAAPGYWDVIGKPNIGREADDDGLGDFTATEFSRMFALGNITREDYESWQWAIETESWVMTNEFRDADSKMGDDDLRMMYGEDRPTLTNEHARRLRSSMQVKKFMASLSVQARGLRSGTEIHAVAKQESGEEEAESSGRLDKLKDYLSG